MALEWEWRIGMRFLHIYKGEWPEGPGGYVKIFLIISLNKQG